MNTLKSDYQLTRHAVKLFPMTAASDIGAVRHARRKWVEAVKYLRDRAGSSHWVLDGITERRTPAPEAPRRASTWAMVERVVNGGRG